jgi:magnesium-transporting ATPase (P-type)
MSEKKNDGEKLVAELKQSKRDASPFVKKWRDFVKFVRFMSAFTFAVLIVACGVYAAAKGIKSTYLLAHVGLAVAGVASSVEGLVLAWRAVIKLEK